MATRDLITTIGEEGGILDRAAVDAPEGNAKPRQLCAHATPDIDMPLRTDPQAGSPGNVSVRARLQLVDATSMNGIARSARMRADDRLNASGSHRPHPRDGSRNDAGSDALPSAVHSRDHSSLDVKQGHRDAVRRQGHQAQSYFGGDQGIDVVDLPGTINDGYLASVNRIHDRKTASF